MARPESEVNVSEIRRSLDLLFQPDQVVELRALGVSTSSYRRAHTVTGYFDDKEALAKQAVSLSVDSKGIYVTMNELKPGLLARSANRVQANIPGTSDVDILLRRYGLIDIDPDTPSGVSATDEEHKAALELTWTICKTLRAEGWPDMPIADSGNGAHLYVPIDLPPDDYGLIKRVLVGASARWSGASGPKVDISVYNPSRIVKLIGTMAKKGDDLPDRPHRLSRWLHIPEVIEPVALELLEALADFAPSSQAADASRGFDIDRWLAGQNVPVRRGPEVWLGGGAGARRWILGECLNGHHDQAPYLIQLANGALKAGCQHQSCQSWGWREFREYYEPGAYQRQTFRNNGAYLLSNDGRDRSGVQLEVVSLSDVVAEKVKWLWPGRIPLGKLTVMGGDAGLGKSYMTLDMAARVSVGGSWPDGGDVELGDVIIATAEDGLADTVRPRLDALEADVSRIHAIGITVKVGAKEVGLSLTEHLAEIEATILEHRAVLLIIDPLLNFTGKGTDTYKTSSVRPILAQMAAMAERTGCAIVSIMHLNKKSSEENALYRLTASGDFTAAARSVLVIGRNPDDPKRRVLAPVKMNLSAPPDSLGFYFTDDGVFAWEVGAVDIDAHSLLAASTVISSGGQLEDAKDFLRVLLADADVASKDIYKEAQEAVVAERTLHRAKNDLGVQVKRVTVGNKGEGRWFWHLPVQDDGNLTRVGNLTDSQAQKAPAKPPQDCQDRKVANVCAQGVDGHLTPRHDDVLDDGEEGAV